MKKYLLFRLYGSMSSWGDIAVGETRPSFSHPTKSAVIGLVAAALGIRRNEENKHIELADSLAFAVLVENTGFPLSDFHTAQVPPAGKTHHCTRKNELSDTSKLNTVLSKRDYRTDGMYTVILWKKKENEVQLNKIAKALNSPYFVLYLGRKSCPLCLPLEPQVIEAESTVKALSVVKFIDIDEFRKNKMRMLYWENSEDVGITPQLEFDRRDIPLSRTRWQFDVRKEMYAALP